MPSCLHALLLLASTVCIAPGAAARVARTDDPALAARLQALVEQLDAQREQLHIPGMALVVVKDDAILLARGFGVSDVERGTPVTPETLFAIGSSSKAFTTALIAMLVTEGRMDWDAPITEYLPFFQLHVDSEDPQAQVTLRDLVCHRTGFTRMGILWAGGRASRDEVLQVAVGAEPWDGFREHFHYNNVMFLAAGEAAARVAATDYDTLLRERLLEPLGMSSSNTSVTASQADPRLSLGYRWDADSEEYVRLPMRVLDTIAPAGAINSNVLDMAQWLRLQLADGVIDGRRLLAAEQIAAMRTPQIEIGGGTSYGLGWMLGEWNGRRVVEHGGNIDGFAAEVALLPEEHLGFVLLTNVTATPLQSTSLPMVWSAVLEGDDVAAPGTLAEPGDTPHTAAPAALDYDEYVGEFIADYGPFDEASFTVQVNGNGKLALDVPGQMLFELEDPDAEGRWFFALTDTIATTFWRDADGSVQSLTMHQGGASFECPRAGYEYPLEFALEDVQRLLGRYDDPALGAEVEVLLRNNRLAVDVPGQTVFELRPPDEEGVWWFRAVPGLGLQFDADESGPATGFLFHERGSKRGCPRVDDELAALTDPAAVRALCSLDGRSGAQSTLGVLRLSGSVRMAQSGVSGRFTWTSDGPERYLTDSDFGKFARVEEAYADGVGTIRSSVGPFQRLSGASLLQARQNHPLMAFGDWSAFGDSFEVAGRESLDGQAVLRVRLLAQGLPAVVLTLDAQTGDTRRQEGKRIVSGLDMELPFSVRFDDYREVHGLRIPHRIVTEDDATGRVILDVERVEVGVAVEAGAFVLQE